MTIPPFQALLDDHAEAIHRFLVALVGPDEAEDALQETLIAALRAYPRLRPDSNVRAWGFSIARNKAIDTARARQRRPLPVDGAGDGLAAPPAPETDAELWAAVRALPPRQRAAVALRFAADLTHRDVGIAMNCTEEAARRSAADGLKRLREALS